MAVTAARGSEFVHSLPQAHTRTNTLSRVSTQTRAKTNHGEVKVDVTVDTDDMDTCTPTLDTMFFV